MSSLLNYDADYPQVSFRQWFHAARPHTWANAIAPVIAGTVAAIYDGQADWLHAVLAVVVAVSLIIGVNYANDYSDGIRGTDTDRCGPLRLTASQRVAPHQVRNAALIAFSVAALAGVVLSVLTAWWLILVGLCCILAAWWYTGGDNPYGYRGLGEVAVFIFFGLVAVLGTEYTQSGVITPLGCVFAVVIGCLSSSVNLANNLRDIPTDSRSGKITLAVLLGDRRTRILWVMLVAVCPIGTLWLAWWHTVWMLFSGIAVLFFLPALRRICRGDKAQELIAVLSITGRGMLVWVIVHLGVAWALA